MKPKIVGDSVTRHTLNPHIGDGSFEHHHKNHLYYSCFFVLNLKN